jgi:two-component system chemotaxis sensor kinase CheA
MHIDRAIDRELLDSFVEDALESLHGFERLVLSLDSVQYRDVLEELFRASHNLKGGAMCVGFESLVDFIHRVEDLIQIVISSNATPTQRVAQALLRSCHCMIAWVRAISLDSQALPEIEGMLSELDALAGELLPTASAEERGAGHSRDHRFTQGELDAIMKEYGWHGREARGHKVARHPLGSGASHAGSEYSRNVVGDPSQSRIPPHVSDSLKVSAKELNDLIGLIQQLSENEDALLAPHDSIEEQHAFALIQAIQSKVRELRVQPLSGLFRRLERTAISLAKSQGKSIRVEVKGGEVQLDKRIVKKISGPLMHIVRNAVDHGIERPRSRAAQGKRREGVIRVVASEKDGSVSIRISDDGRGLNEKDIRAAAVKRGVIKEGQRLSLQKIQELIFVQGVSTASKLTKVSGRGVGMDVVIHAARNLGGFVKLSSKRGKGTTVTITLPREY